MPTSDDLRTWAQLCHADEHAAGELLDLLGEAHAVHLDWKRRMRRGQVAVQANYNQLVQGAKTIRHFETIYVPGLLQTPAYASRVLNEQAELHDLDVKDVEQAVATRMARQAFVYQPGKHFEFLLSEAVLRFLLTSPDVMRGQLDRLQTIIGTPNVRFGIVPFGIPLETTPQNSFQTYDDLVIVETFVGETTYTGAEADAYLRAMERLWKHAVIDEAARRLIVQAAEVLPRT